MSKKPIVIFFLLVLVLSLINAAAEGAEILFRNIPWGATLDEAISLMPEDMVFPEPKTSELWCEVPEHIMYDILSLDDQHKYRGDMGCYLFANGKHGTSLADLHVAGYPVTELSLEFLYNVKTDGTLLREKQATSFIYGYYIIEAKDPEYAYNDLAQKLTKMYGESVDSRSDGGHYISYDFMLWRGDNGTMVSLEAEKHDSGNTKLYLRYSFDGANDLLHDAYEAVLLEERMNADSNFDGL